MVIYQADEFTDGLSAFTKFDEAAGSFKRCIRNHLGARVPPFDFHKCGAGQLVLLQRIVAFTDPVLGTAGKRIIWEKPKVLLKTVDGEGVVGRQVICICRRVE